MALPNFEVADAKLYEICTYMRKVVEVKDVNETSAQVEIGEYL